MDHADGVLRLRSIACMAQSSFGVNLAERPVRMILACTLGGSRSACLPKEVWERGIKGGGNEHDTCSIFGSQHHLRRRVLLSSPSSFTCKAAFVYTPPVNTFLRDGSSHSSDQLSPGYARRLGECVILESPLSTWAFVRASLVGGC